MISYLTNVFFLLRQTADLSSTVGTVQYSYRTYQQKLICKSARISSSSRNVNQTSKIVSYNTFHIWYQFYAYENFGNPHCQMHNSATRWVIWGALGMKIWTPSLAPLWYKGSAWKCSNGVSIAERCCSPLCASSWWRFLELSLYQITTSFYRHGGSGRGRGWCRTAAHHLATFVMIYPCLHMTPTLPSA